MASRFGIEVSLAHPEGYDLIPEVVALSKKQAKAVDLNLDIIPF